MNWFILKGLYFVELSRQRLVSEMQNMVSKEEVSTLEKKMNNLKVQLDNTLQKLHESEEVVSKERARGENLQIQKEVSASNHRNEKCDFCIYSKTFCEMDKKQTLEQFPREQVPIGNHGQKSAASVRLENIPVNGRRMWCPKNSFTRDRLLAL